MTQDHTPDQSADISPVKRALLELREMRAKLEAAERERSEPIAVVGMGCRFPGADGPDALWQLLRDGVDAIREVPADRWSADAYYDTDLAAPGKMSTRWGGFLDGIDRFDPHFFGISPREAMAMDPQQRLLLEVGWEALEHAGIAPDRLSGTAAGVFMGISSFDYVHLAMSAPEETLDSYLAQGIAHSAASGRLAYILGLQGPAVSLDTACSSSLVAVHLAVQSLRRGECSLALAGGANAILLPTFLIGFSKSQMMAADGRCKTFDASADGFVRGEGCGVVVLKRLSDALAERDQIWAVIRGSAANQDGRSSGMTAPNGLAQEAVLRAALADARLEPRQVGYVEAHGTGTSLGDPIEVQALHAVLGRGRAPDRPLLLGSIKTNLGHLEAAAGVASVIKAALALHHGEIPSSLHFRQPNPYIAWDEFPVAVAAERTPFPAIDGRRVAGVSSFGFTGTNVHVVLEAAREEGRGKREEESSSIQNSQFTIQNSAAQRPLHLLKLCARDETALQNLSGRWTRFLKESPEPFTDLCFTATTGRADLPERLAVVAASAAEARRKLAAHARGEEPLGVFRGRAADGAQAQVAFLFSGHGSQRVDMGRRLYETQPTYRAALEECDALLRPYLDQPLLSVLYPTGGGTGTDSPLLDGMTYSQPALFALEYALARLWRAWGVEPAAVLGHSVGEYAAAVVAGVFSLEDGLKLVAARGRLMDSLTRRGAMLAVFASPAEVEALLAPHDGAVSIAAINAPTESVVSGESAAIEAIADQLTTRGTDFRRLHVAQAAHSRLLDPILDDFEAVAATVRFAAPQIQLISCTTGQPVSAAEIADPRYWRRHLRETVRFHTALETLHREGYGVFLEIGPHAVLTALGNASTMGRGGDGAMGSGGAEGQGRNPESEIRNPLCLPSLRREWDDWQQMLESLAALYVHGVPVDWQGFERDHLDAGEASRRRVSAPTYAWTHGRYWLEHAARPGSRRIPAPVAERAWEAVVEAGRRQEAQGPLDLVVHSFPERWRVLSRLSTAMIAATLRELGAFHARDRAHTADEVTAELGILPRYRRLVARWLRRLTGAGLLREVDGRYLAEEEFAATEVATAWREAERVLSDWSFMLEYLRRCGELLPRVLTGRAEALETIFPDGSFATAEQLYRDSVLPRYFNALAGAIVAAFAASRAGEPIRALEVGGGTAGTTGTLLPLVERSGGSYHFTDVSDLFLARAAERFGDRQRIGFGLLDIDRDPGDQGYAPGSFDVIVAANVLHAASDLPTALEGMRALLAPGGLLLLVEVTTYLDWFDVSTALLEGWDRQGDELRPDHPMLAADTWQRALREAGFVAAAAFPGAGSPAEVMAQHVLMAQAPLAPVVGAEVTATAEASGANGAAAFRARTAQEDAAAAFAARLAAAAPHEREDLLVEYVRNHIAALLRLDSPQGIERRGRLMELGLDSLMAVELRSRLSRGLTLAEPLPATLIFDFPTVDAIAGLLSRLLEPAAAEAAGSGLTRVEATTADPAVPVGAVFSSAATDDLDSLTDEEVEARLLARLESLEERSR
jgi:acyl transferase domain-containing protein/SAM-dependent methyltransferase